MAGPRRVLLARSRWLAARGRRKVTAIEMATEAHCSRSCHPGSWRQRERSPARMRQTVLASGMTRTARSLSPWAWRCLVAADSSCWQASMSAALRMAHPSNPWMERYPPAPGSSRWRAAAAVVATTKAEALAEHSSCCPSALCRYRSRRQVLRSRPESPFLRGLPARHRHRLPAALPAPAPAGSRFRKPRWRCRAMRQTRCRQPRPAPWCLRTAAE